MQWRHANSVMDSPAPEFWAKLEILGRKNVVAKYIFAWFYPGWLLLFKIVWGWKDLCIFQFRLLVSSDMAQKQTIFSNFDDSLFSYEIFQSYQ